MKNTNNINNNNNCKMEGFDWEMRPGGMLVQKRNLDSPKNNINLFNPYSTIKVYVKFGSSYHHIHIQSHATFGDLKKMVTKATGLNPDDQKLIYKDKEGESRAFLDVCGVKNGSKITLVANLESQTNCSMGQQALKSVEQVTLDVNKLVSKVTTIECVICKGGVVDEKEFLTLIELLMSQLIKLDGIIADGDVKLKRKMQVIRIQKYIDILDRLKTHNSKTMKHGTGHVGLIESQKQQPLILVQNLKEPNFFTRGQINFTPKWEKF